jgi:hypothetical protein
MARTTVKRQPSASRREPRSRSNLILRGPVSVDDLLQHRDPGPPEEAEEFVRLIYELRRKTRPPRALFE